MSFGRILIGIGAAVTMCLTLLVSSASADTQRAVRNTFGPDGTFGTTFPEEHRVAFDQVSKRLYVAPLYINSGMRAFDMSNPAVPVPLPEPVIAEKWPDRAAPAVDNSNTATQGRFYLSYAHPWFPEDPSALRAYTYDGTKEATELKGVFPIQAGSPGGFCTAAVDSQGNVAVTNANQGAVDDGRAIERFTSSGVRLLSVDTKKYQDSGTCFIAFDAADNLYANVGKSIWKYTPESNYTVATKFIEVEKGEVGGSMVIDKSTGHLFISRGEAIAEYDENGKLLLEFGSTYKTYRPNFYSITVNEGTNEVYALDMSQSKVHVFGPPFTVPKVTTDRPDSVTTTGAIVHGHIEVDGSPAIVECFFQYGLDVDYSEGEKPCTPPASPGAPITADTDVQAQLTSLLSQEALYHYRLVVKTAQGIAVGKDQTLITADVPQLGQEKVIEVTADHVLLDGAINPRGVFSKWKIEYGTGDCAVTQCQSTPEQDLVNCDLLFGCLPTPKGFTAISKEIIGLTPATQYHFRFVGSNDQGGVGYGTDHTFRTFPLDPAGSDPCPNAHERKLSSASKLTRCRAYELVSAIDAGGYDVSSNIVEGETPLGAYPQADDRFIYTTAVGKLPGILGNPVNLGTDPYVATRGPGGWTTKYVGLSATIPSDSPFASTMTGSDAGLNTFAFGAADRCSPCFADGSTGIPLRRSDGSLIQGMSGSLAVANPESAGQIDEQLSANANHFIFGSKQKFEPAGNENALTIYDRNLSGGTTQVVSTMPDGSTMTGEVVELDLSADGSRVLIGRPIGSDSEGNVQYDLYMHVGTSPNSVAIVDTPNGAIYNGMSDDGTKVYFSTADKLLDDTDASADIFRADVGPSSATLTRVSAGAGGTGNSDACTPPDDWNVPDGGPNCSALAFAGGAGVASGDGTFFFLSPEQLDGPSNGLKEQPNLYISRPGSAPKFVGLFDDSTIKPPPSPPRHPIATKSFGGGHSEITGMAVDLANDDVYVAERERISRYNSEGQPHLFSAGSGAGTNKIGGIYTGGAPETGIAVDNAPTSPLKGSLYFINTFYGIDIYAPSGEKLGGFSMPGFSCGLAIDQNSGDVYVGEYGGTIRKFHPTSGATPVSGANYTETSILIPSMQPCQLGVDSDPSGYVYASNYSQGPLRQFAKSDFAASPPELLGKQIADFSKTVSVDPLTNEIYVEEGQRISVYTAAGGPPIASVGVGTLTPESTVMVINGNTKHVFANRESNIIDFGFEIVPFLQIDNPAILRAVEQSEVHRTDDFQVTPNGDIATFTTKVQLTSTPSDGNSQVYRYDAPGDKLNCASCTPTGAFTTSDAFLAPNGSNLSVDGRVFFTSNEQLTLRDTNRRTDAYEWDSGVISLISTGTGVVNAALASVDATGKNAYFFTRESIVPQDDNGATMKVYTAREAGGYTFLPNGVPCQAADECRGPGTVVPPPPAIGTYKGTGGNVREPAKCKKGQVRKNGHCVKKHRKSAKAKRHKRGSHRG